MDAVAGGLIGASIVAFVNGGWNYYNNRKSAPEVLEAKREELQTTHENKRDAVLLDFWMGEVHKVEERQTIELKEIKNTFEADKKALSDRHTSEIQSIRQEAQAEKTSSDMLMNSLQSEIRQMIKDRGNDQLEFQKQLSELKDGFHKQLLEIEKEKTAFMESMLDRFEQFCKDLKGNNYGQPNSHSRSEA